jgi:hypothetical protein
LLCIGREKHIRRAGLGIAPSLRDRAYDDFAYKLVGSLGEKGSVYTTLRENVSAARNRFTSGRKGVLALPF